MTPKPITGSDQSVLLVLGMHRSGTSVLTRVFNLLGVALGSELLQPQCDNSKGFWEHAAAVDIHETLLAALDRKWHDVRDLPEGWMQHPATEHAISRIVELVRGELHGHAMWAVKDPRMCRLAPVWLTALERLGVQARVVIVVRDPREVALSLRKRDGWTPGHAYLMWIQHLMEAVAVSREIPRAMVAYSQLLDDWRDVMAKVATELNIQWPVTLKQAGPEVDAFIDPQDRHQRADGRELPPELEGAPLPTLLEAAYADAQAIAAGHADWDALADCVATYGTVADVFTLPLNDLMVERNALERVALERMTHIEGLVIAKELTEQREQELRASFDEQAARLARVSEEAEGRAATLLAAEGRLSEQRREMQQLALDRRELDVLRDAMERERSFLERSFAASDKLEAELRANLAERDGRIQHLLDEQARAEEEFAAQAKATVEQQAQREMQAAQQQAELQASIAERDERIQSLLDEQARAAKDLAAQMLAAEQQAQDARQAALQTEQVWREVDEARQQAEARCAELEHQLTLEAEAARNMSDVLSEHVSRIGEMQAAIQVQASELEATKAALLERTAMLDEVTNMKRKLSVDVEQASQSCRTLEQELAEVRQALAMETANKQEMEVRLGRANELANSRRWLLRRTWQRFIGRTPEHIGEL